MRLLVLLALALALCATGAHGFTSYIFGLIGAAPAGTVFSSSGGMAPTTAVTNFVSGALPDNFFWEGTLTARAVTSGCVTFAVDFDLGDSDVSGFVYINDTLTVEWSADPASAAESFLGTSFATFGLLESAAIDAQSDCRRLPNDVVPPTEEESLEIFEQGDRAVVITVQVPEGAGPRDVVLHASASPPPQGVNAVLVANHRDGALPTEQRWIWTVTEPTTCTFAAATCGDTTASVRTSGRCAEIAFVQP